LWQSRWRRGGRVEVVVEVVVVVAVEEEVVVKLTPSSVSSQPLGRLEEVVAVAQ